MIASSPRRDAQTERHDLRPDPRVCSQIIDLHWAVVSGAGDSSRDRTRHASPASPGSSRIAVRRNRMCGLHGRNRRQVDGSCSRVAVGVPAAIEEDLQGHVPRIPETARPFWPSTPGRDAILPAALRPIGQHPAVQRETTGSVQLDAVQGDEPPLRLRQAAHGRPPDRIARSRSRAVIATPEVAVTSITGGCCGRVATAAIASARAANSDRNATNCASTGSR